MLKFLEGLKAIIYFSLGCLFTAFLWILRKDQEKIVNNYEIGKIKGKGEAEMKAEVTIDQVQKTKSERKKRRFLGFLRSKRSNL